MNNLKIGSKVRALVNKSMFDSKIDFRFPYRIEGFIPSGEIEIHPFDVEYDEDLGRVVSLSDIQPWEEYSEIENAILDMSEDQMRNLLLYLCKQPYSFDVIRNKVQDR